MNWNDYVAVWKRQPLPVGESADLRELRATFETKRRKLAATLWVRDLTELLACVVLVWVYSRYWQKVGPTGWPMGLAILMIVFVASAFIRERWRVRRSRLGPEASLRAKIEADLAELHHQRHLLLRVWAWYIAPCAAAILIHLGVIVAHDQERRPTSWVVASIFAVAACGGIWALNRRAVRKQIEPRLAELQKLHRDVLAGQGSDAPAR